MKTDNDGYHVPKMLPVVVHQPGKAEIILIKGYQVILSEAIQADQAYRKNESAYKLLFLFISPVNRVKNDGDKQ